MKHLPALALVAFLTACVPAAEQEPAPTPKPAATTPPSPKPSPTATFASWMDAPATPGDWTLKVESGATTALFGDAASGARLSLRCDRASRMITIARAGTGTAPPRLLLRSEFGDRQLAATASSDPMPEIRAVLNAGDPLFDNLALSKGRFAVESPGLSTVVAPSWAEVSRVVEDCR